MTIWHVPVPAGEVIDKITILRLKARHISDPAKLAHIRQELALLEDIAAEALPQIAGLTAELADINAALWQIEDDIRDHESRADFGESFIALARAVYHRNDARAAVKRAINAALGSTLVEEKSYRDYRTAHG